MSSALTRVCTAALDLVLPHTCFACEQLVAARGLFCATCFGQITLIAQPLCRCCGVPFESRDHAGRLGLCLDCAADPPEFERARAAFRYDDRSRGLVLGLKHADRTDLARSLAPFIARAGGELLAAAADRAALQPGRLARAGTAALDRPAGAGRWADTVPADPVARPLRPRRPGTGTGGRVRGKLAAYPGDCRAACAADRRRHHHRCHRAGLRQGAAGSRRHRRGCPDGGTGGWPLILSIRSRFCVIQPAAIRPDSFCNGNQYERACAPRHSTAIYADAGD